MMKSWVNESYTNVHNAALKRLQSSRVLVKSQADKSMYSLNPAFRKHLQQVLIVLLYHLNVLWFVASRQCGFATAFILYTTMRR
jgi:hypothetical protein